MRTPVPQDGGVIHSLVESSEFLDGNSLYCYLLICSHFSSTSVVAEQTFSNDSGEAEKNAGEESAGKEIVGFISAYRVPDRHDTLFVWQVGVSAKARRQGIAGRMLREILGREACKEVRYLETTVTGDNAASRRLFQSLGEELDCPLQESVMFDKEAHFGGQHDSEHLLRIGPFEWHSHGRQ